MRGRQEIVLLIGGYVFFASLAAPAVLFATEDPQPPPTASEAPAPSAPPTLDEQPPGTLDEPSPATLDEQPPAPDEQPTAESPPERDEKTDVSALTPAGPTQATKNASARASATRTVAMRDIKFKPRNITIDPGDTVQWRNDDPERHNALGESGSFETPVIAKDETSSHTFNRKGSYPYFCSLHAGMDGRITVGASSGGGSGDSGGGSGGGGSGTGATGATGTSTAGSSTGSTGTTGTTSTLGSGAGSTSTLPATGSDLVWLALIGAGLLTLGAATALVARRVY
jgi:LPXTG-motif cell wall-anchored protein